MAPFTTLQQPAMYAPKGSYAPRGSYAPVEYAPMAPRTGTIMVSSSAYPAPTYSTPIRPLQVPGTISVVQATKKSIEPAGGVGIAFEDRLDQLSGGMLKIVAEIFTEGAAADWNSTASENEMIHPGDLLMEVNGEKVERISMHMLSTMVPGPVGTPVILRLRSVKRNNEFEVHSFFASAYAPSTRKRHRRAAFEFS